MPLDLADGVTVEVIPPAMPVWEVAPPAAASPVMVIPVVGPQGPAGLPGRDGDGVGGSQLVVTGVAETVLSGHRVVTRPPSGLLGYADNRNPDHVHAPLLLTTGAASAGEEIAVVAFGPVVEPSWSWVPGPVYLGQDGQLVQVPPSGPVALFLVQVAVAESAVSVFFARQPSILLNP